MTPKQLRKLRGKRTQKTMAELLGYCLRHYQMLEAGDRKISEKLAFWITHKIALDDTSK